MVWCWKGKRESGTNCWKDWLLWLHCMIQRLSIKSYKSIISRILQDYRYFKNFSLFALFAHLWYLCLVSNCYNFSTFEVTVNIIINGSNPNQLNEKGKFRILENWEDCSFSMFEGDWLSRKIERLTEGGREGERERRERMAPMGKGVKGAKMNDRERHQRWLIAVKSDQKEWSESISWNSRKMKLVPRGEHKRYQHF